MNYQIVNSNKEVEKFIKDNLALQFSKVEEISFAKFLISTAYNLAKSSSQFIGYSLIDIYLSLLYERFKEEVYSFDEDSVIVENAIQKLKPFITYIYVYKNDETDNKNLSILDKLGVKYITLNMFTKNSKEHFLNVFKKYKK
ncbi:hypothetical protein DAC20_126 [Bacteroides phage DAC20]|nr:hypothetical protein DAC16_120 [Bacteroides phage DAC16]QIG63618.1 hypothetical protein DAC19_127 [Bacteroides phage DAC19]QIG63879.1 hypothetical protein DAC20_126 [Bacteroides phage DAC20]QIG64142.1 hypothetical protein DAC22_128 [Bacteroides phage DAC22]QIG64399.1 hypothetical protein DAC23_121 [Bacteroides phage DAC23]